MIIEFKQTSDDFLQYMLYSTSHSLQAKKQRRKSWIIVTLMCFLAASVFFATGNKSLAIYFLSFGVVTLLFYPRYQRVQYKKHFLRNINETYANRIGQTATYNFNDAAVITESQEAGSTINYEAFESFNETGAYWFLKLKSGGSLILPKQVLKDAEGFKLFLTDKAALHQVAMLSELDWKWR